MARIVPYYNPNMRHEEDTANRSERLLDALMVELTGKAASPHEEMEYVRKILEIAMPETVARVTSDKEIEDINFVLPIMPTTMH